MEGYYYIKPAAQDIIADIEQYSLIEQNRRRMTVNIK